MDEDKVLFEGVDELTEEFDIYFNECLSGKAPVAFITRQQWRPAIDLYETADGVHLVVELGGLAPGDIHVEYRDGALTLSGRRDSFVPDNPVEYHCMEINAGPFERKIALRAPVDPATIRAACEGGILRVEMERSADVVPGHRSIPVIGGPDHR